MPAVVVILCAAAVLASVIWLSNRSTRQDVVEMQTAEAKTSELEQLIAGDHNCVEVIQQAEVFLDDNPRAGTIWHLKGVCEFDAGNFAAAQVSFEKVLDLIPGHAAAQNYLQRLRSDGNEIMVAAAEIPIAKGEFEASLGLAFSQVLQFENAVERPANIPEYLWASYGSTGNFAETVSFLKGELDKAEMVYTVSELEDDTILAAGSDTERKIFMIEKGEKVRVNINYQKLN